MKFMNKLGIYTKQDAIKNFSRKEKAQAKNIEIQQLERASAQIENWRQALQYAEDVEAPDRTELIRLYNEVLLDDGVDGFVESLENRIHASDFDVVDNEGNVKEDARNIFNQEWFDEIVSSYVLSILKGYRLIEMLPKDGKIDRLKDIFIFLIITLFHNGGK